MKLAKILSTLTSEPLLLDDSARTSLLQLFEQHATLNRAEFAAQRTAQGPCGETIELDSMEVDENGIAWIPIGGPIGLGLGNFEKRAGAIDLADIRADLEEADQNEAVTAVVLLMDCPGGMVSGTPELADLIAAYEKPIYAFTNGGAIASAAYWLASACDGIFATKSADIGSIGVYAPFLDLSKAADMQGIKVKVFSSGKYKAMGVPGTSLTPEQEIFMQNRVMEIARMFYTHVRAMRTDVKDEDMQGQLFKAAEALSRGLIDGVIADQSELAHFLA